jgi:hypothetical protein
MPVHDWTRVDDGIFHDLHSAWISEIRRVLNRGLLPPDYFALAEQIAGGIGPDVRQRTIVIRHASGHRIVALIEILSPGNKSNRHGLRAFLDKALAALGRGIHLLLIDLHPPGPRDPQGIHGVLWREVAGDPYEPPGGKPLTLVAYAAGAVKTAYVEPLAVGDALPDMPLFLTPELYVNVPLERTYQDAYEGVPRLYRGVLEA